MGIEVLDSRVLVLNKSYMPIRTITVFDAMAKLFGETVEAIAIEENGSYTSYDFESWSEISSFRKEFEKELDDGKRIDWIRTPSLHLMVPRVVRLLTYDKIPQVIARLTRKGIYERDGYTCQYCGKRYRTENLNIDHIVPRSRGGVNSWENLVCSCITCNRKKRNRTPKEAGMRLLSKPHKPKPSFDFKVSGPDHYEDWDHFVSDQYWNTTIKE